MPHNPTRMSDRRYCETCDRWVGGGVAHDHREHDFAGPGPIASLHHNPDAEELFDA